MLYIFRVICWTLAVYFFVSAHSVSSFPIKIEVDSITPLLISLFLLLLPFSKSLSVGNFFRYEAQVEQLKNEVRDFKTEIRTLVNLQSSAFSSVASNVSQQTNINLPPISDAYNAEKIMAENLPHLDAAAENEFSDFISEGLSDANLALAKLRMELEQEFRRVLGKRTHLGEKVDMKFLSLRSLWREFFKRWPEKRYLTEGLQYVNDVANAAIHGQIVPREHAEEALAIGIRVLNQLRQIQSNG